MGIAGIPIHTPWGRILSAGESITTDSDRNFSGSACIATAGDCMPATGDYVITAGASIHFADASVPSDSVRMRPAGDRILPAAFA